MDREKQTNLFPLIAAGCLVGVVLTDVLDTLHWEYTYNVWGYLWAILTIVGAAALFLRNKPAVMGAAGAMVLMRFFQIISRGLTWYLALTFLAYAALAALAFFSLQKSNLVRTLWFVPGALMALMLIIYWIFRGEFSGLFRGWITLWQLLSDLLIIAGMGLAGLWLAQTTETADGRQDPWEPGFAAGRSADSAAAPVPEAEGYCGLAKHVLLLLFTCGIWYLIWIYRTTGFLNRVEDEEPRNPTRKLLLCLFVPFYSIYWTYISAQRIDKMAARRGIPSDIATLCLILAIFVGIVPPILMQDMMNKIVTAGEGEARAPFQPQAPQTSFRPEEPVNDTSVNETTRAYKEPAPAPDPVTELRRYKELLDSGIITQEEFEAKKKQLLNL